MGAGVPQVNLFVLGAGDKLLHGRMDIETPQLICVTLRVYIKIKKYLFFFPVELYQQFTNMLSFFSVAPVPARWESECRGKQL